MRLDSASNIYEKVAAQWLKKLAVSVHDVGYYCSESITPATQKALEKAFRVLRPATEFYFDDAPVSCWDLPTGRFQPKVKR